MKINYIIFNERPFSPLIQSQIIPLLTTLSKNKEITLFQFIQFWNFKSHKKEIIKTRLLLSENGIKVKFIPFAFPDRDIFCPMRELQHKAANPRITSVLIFSSFQMFSIASLQEAFYFAARKWIYFYFFAEGVKHATGDTGDTGTCGTEKCLLVMPRKRARSNITKQAKSMHTFYVHIFL